MPVLGMQYSEVVAAIKAGGDETKLLVVDLETEEYFKRCNVQPTEYHITGTATKIDQQLSLRGGYTVYFSVRYTTKQCLVFPFRTFACASIREIRG